MEMAWDAAAWGQQKIWEKGQMQEEGHRRDQQRLIFAHKSRIPVPHTLFICNKYRSTVILASLVILILN